MALEVIINDVSIDLFQGSAQDFAITQQIHDLRDLQTRNASFTNGLQVPLTDLNKTVFAETFPVVNGQSVSPTRLRAQVLMSGVPVILDGEASAQVKEGDSLSVIFYFSNFELFANISERISLLNWADLNFTFDPAGWNTNKANTTGLVTALATWIDGVEFTKGNTPITSSLELEHDLNFSGFHIYLREIITRIIVQAGFAFDDTDMVGETDYTTLALACPVEKFDLLLDVTNPLEGEVDRITTAQTENTQAVHRVEFNNTVTDPLTLWDGATFQWDFVSSGTINITVNIDGQHTKTGNRSSSIRIVKNTTIIEERDISDLNELDLTILSTTSIINGDFLAVEIDLDSNSTVEISISSNFVLNEVGTVIDRDIFVAEHLPDIESKVFLQSVLAYFNAVIDTNDDTKTVKMLKFNDIRDSEEQELTDNMDTSRAIIENNGLLSYFQTSRFKYSDARSRRIDTSAVFRFNDDLLDKFGVLVELVFGASDNAMVRGLSTRTTPIIEVPNYTFEAFDEVGLTYVKSTSVFTLASTPNEAIKVGDYIESTTKLVGGQFMDLARVIQITPTFAIEGTWSTVLTGPTNAAYRIYRYEVNSVDTPRISNIVATQGDYNAYNGTSFTTRAIVQNGLEAEFSDSMLWSNLKTAHYQTMLDALNPAKVVLAWFLFTPMEFRNLDLKKPVYLKGFSERYFINNAPQYKENRPIRLELVKI